jgi:ankyrin repeat protein
VLILFLVTILQSIVVAQSAQASSPAGETKEQTETVSENGDETELIEAIKKGDIARVLLLLENGVSPDATDTDHSPALCWAVRANRADIAEALLKRNAKVDQEEDDGGTALQAAAAMGRANLVKLLIAHGADVNARDRDGHNVLMCAALGAMIKSAPAWIAKQFMKIDDEDEDKLAYLGDEHVAVVNLLLASGADVNAQADDCGLTALMAAAMGGNIEVGRILVAHGANVNLKGGSFTALTFAEMGEDPEELQKMLDGESDEESKQAMLNWLQFTRPGRLEFAAMLRKAGAKNNLPDNPPPV